jgi:hypothetical protein
MTFNQSAAEKQFASFGPLFNTAEHSDCQVVFASGTTLHLHKIINCCQNDFFKSCFSSGMQESEHNKIIIDKDEDERLLTILIQTLYTAQLECELSEIVDIIFTAEKYTFEHWVSLLSEHLSKNITENNALQCLQLNLEVNSIVKNGLKRFFANSSENILNEQSYLEMDPQVFPTVAEMLVTTNNGDKVQEAVHHWIAR